MKAVGYQQSLPITADKSLEDIELATPTAKGRDLLIKVSAIAVNPVDYKVRQWMSPEEGEYRVLGWDAVGEVVAIGEQVTLFQPGDRVFYAGDLNRAGSNAEYQVVDERIVGHAPKSVSDSDAAALPLTSITAWELLFDHLKLPTISEAPASPRVLLVVGAAGGVGSILLQLAKKLTKATVIATASRPETQEWVTALGADYVINHAEPLAPQIEKLGIGAVTDVASLTHTQDYFADYAEALKPKGKIVLIDDPDSLDLSLLKPKSLSVHWEFMFTRSTFATDDMDEQGKLLSQVADLIDKGTLKVTTGQHLGCISADNLKQAHELLESGKTVGKLVLEGFE